MNEQARLFYLTNPAPGVYLINLQVGEQFTRVEISKAQLAGVVADGAAMARRAMEPAE